MNHQRFPKPPAGFSSPGASPNAGEGASSLGFSESSCQAPLDSSTSGEPPTSAPSEKAFPIASSHPGHAATPEGPEDPSSGPFPLDQEEPIPPAFLEEVGNPTDSLWEPEEPIAPEENSPGRSFLQQNPAVEPHSTPEKGHTAENALEKKTFSGEQPVRDPAEGQENGYEPLGENDYYPFNEKKGKPQKDRADTLRRKSPPEELEDRSQERGPSHGKVPEEGIQSVPRLRKPGFLTEIGRSLKTSWIHFGAITRALCFRWQKGSQGAGLLSRRLKRGAGSIFQKSVGGVKRLTESTRSLLSFFRRVGFTALPGGRILFLWVGLASVALWYAALSRWSNLVRDPAFWQPRASLQSELSRAREAQRTVAVANRLRHLFLRKPHPAPFLSAALFCSVSGLTLERLEYSQPVHGLGKLRLVLDTQRSPGLPAVGAYGAMVMSSYQKLTGRKLHLELDSVTVPRGDQTDPRVLGAVLVAKIVQE